MNLVTSLKKIFIAKVNKPITAIYLPLLLLNVFVIFGAQDRAYGATCGINTTCGTAGTSCYATLVSYPGGGNPNVTCPLDPTYEHYASECKCDGGLYCNEGSSYTCEVCGGEGDNCCAGRDPTCDAPFVCNSSTNKCENDVTRCDDYLGDCCTTGVAGAPDYCEDSSLYGDMSCVAGVCVPVQQCDGMHTYGRDVPACCNDEGEACCGGGIGHVGGSCNEGWECISGFCKAPGSAETCGVDGVMCCPGGTYGVCTDGSIPTREGATSCMCRSDGGVGPSIFEILAYEGPIITDLPTLLSPIFKILFYAGLVIGVFGMIYSGYLFISSEGDPGRVKEGKDQFTATILGTLFVLLSVLILRVIINDILGVNSGL